MAQSVPMPFISEGNKPLRGTDVGNGGDPIREVFNAARIYATDLIKKLPPEKLEQEKQGAKLATQITSAYAEVYEALLAHLEHDIHDWADYSQLTDCAANDPDQENILKLSYANCSKMAPNAALAVPILFTATFRNLIKLREEEQITLVQALTRMWPVIYADSYAAARAQKLSYTPLIGEWQCAKDQNTMNARIYPEGLFKFDQQLKNGEVRFMDFLQWQEAEKRFRAFGMWSYERFNNQGDPNIVQSNVCRYKILATLTFPTPDGLALTVHFGGKSEDAGCGVSKAERWEYTCSRKANARH